MLQAYCEDSHHKWDEHIHELALALRTAVNETTQVSPALLNLGREIPLPFDRNLQPEENLTDLATFTTLPTRMAGLLEYVRHNLTAGHEVNKKRYDTTHRQDIFKPGDLVLRKAHILSSREEGIMQKLAHRWEGPYELGKRTASLTFELLQLPEKTVACKRHVSQLKLYTEREPGTSQLPVIQTNSANQQLPQRVLRNRPRVDYRTLAGHRDRSLFIRRAEDPKHSLTWVTALNWERALI